MGVCWLVSLGGIRGAIDKIGGDLVNISGKLGNFRERVGTL